MHPAPTTPFRFWTTAPVWMVVLCLAFLLAACDSGSSNGDNGPEPDVEGPLYVLSNTVFNQDNAAAYITVVPDLNADQEITDLSQFVEFTGGGRAYGLPQQDVIYFHSGEDATVTEVIFAPDGSATLGRELSFAGEGVTIANFGSSLHISPTKAYFVSQQTYEIIAWNPKEMEITAVFPMGLAVDSGLRRLVGEVFLVGDEAVILSYQDDGDFIARPGMAVTVVDTQTDAVVSNTVDPRATGLRSSAIDANGDRYFGPNDNISGQHYLTPDLAPAPMILRMRAGETSFDPDWSRSLTDELGTTLWGCCTQGPAGTIFVQAFPEDDPLVATVEENYEFGSFPFVWYEFNSGAPVEPAEVDVTGIPYGGAIPVDGDGYLVIWDDATSTIMRTTAPGGPAEGVEVPGFVYNIVRIR